MKQLSRRNFVRGAALGAAAVSTAGVLSACGTEPAPQDTPSETPPSSEPAGTPAPEATVLSPTVAPTAETASNMGIVPDSQTEVGSTYENLVSAIAGETGATAKYETFAAVAEREGYEQIARLFTCTAEAEKIHIELEYNLAVKMDASTERPPMPSVDEYTSDVNLILGANGEIYETSDMYPAFIQVAEDEGEAEAVTVFTRAKLAESVHAQRYLDAYNTIDTPSDEPYYLCPICGYIHMGENFTACPICLAPKSSFVAY